MTESRFKKTSKNLIFTVIAQLLKLALVFIGRIIFVRLLDSSYLGINGLFSNILSILSLADLGMTTAMMYSLYKPLATNDTKKVKQYINFFKRVYNCIALVVCIVGLLFVPFLKYIVNLPSDMPNIYIYYLLLLLNSILSYLFIYKTTLLQADQKMYVINKYDMIFQIILFIAQITVLYLTRSFALYLIVNILCTFLGNIFKVHATNKIYPYLQNSENEELSTKDKKSVFNNIKSLFLYKLGSIIQSNTDNILISIFVGTIAVGYYSNYSTVITQGALFLTLIFTSLKASVGNFQITKNKKEQYEMFNIIEVYNYLLVGTCSILLLALLPNFIELCFGKEYILSNTALIFIVLNFYTSNIRQTLWVYRETSGIFSKTKYITLVTSTLNLILSLIFGYFYGLVGIIGATVLSRMIFAWWREPLIIYKDLFNANPNDYYKKYIFRMILTVFIYIVIESIISFINIDNLLLKLIIDGFISVLIIGFFYFIIYRKNKATQFMIDKLKNIKKSGKVN